MQCKGYGVDYKTCMRNLVHTYTHKTKCGVQCVLTLTSFSESPRHLLTIEEAEMLKKVVPHSVATALASMVLPVPATHTHTQKHYNYVHNVYVVGMCQPTRPLTKYTAQHTFHKINVQNLQCQAMRGAIERGSSIIPGGPYSSSPFQGERMPVNSWGYWEEGGRGGGGGWK